MYGTDVEGLLSRGVSAFHDCVRACYSDRFAALGHLARPPPLSPPPPGSLPDAAAAAAAAATADDDGGGGGGLVSELTLLQMVYVLSECWEDPVLVAQVRVSECWEDR